MNLYETVSVSASRVCFTPHSILAFCSSLGMLEGGENGGGSHVGEESRKEKWRTGWWMKKEKGSEEDKEEEGRKRGDDGGIKGVERRKR